MSSLLLLLLVRVLIAAATVVVVAVDVTAAAAVVAAVVDAVVMPPLLVSPTAAVGAVVLTSHSRASHAMLRRLQQLRPRGAGGSVRGYFSGGGSSRPGWNRRRTTQPVLSSWAAVRLVAFAGRLAAAAPRPATFFGGVASRLRLLLIGLPFLPTVCHRPCWSGSSSSTSLSGVPRLWRESRGAGAAGGLGLPPFAGGGGPDCGFGRGGEGGQGGAVARMLDAESCAALNASKLSEPGGRGTDGRAVEGRGGWGGPPGFLAMGARAACAIDWACSGVREPGGGRRRRPTTSDQRRGGLAWLGAGPLLLLSGAAEEDGDERAAAAPLAWLTEARSGGVGRTRGGETSLSALSSSRGRLW